MFRPEDGAIPLSRRPREQIELAEDGSATVFTAGRRRPPRRAARPPGRRTAGAVVDPHERRAPSFVSSISRRTAWSSRSARRSARLSAARSCLLMAKKDAALRRRSLRSERARRASGVGAALPARPRRAARAGRFASTRSTRRSPIAWAASRRCSCRTRSSRRARSARCFKSSCEGAPKPLAPTPLDLDDPHLLLSSGLAPTPSNGRFHLQMVYAVCSLTYAAFRRALGRDIAWATARAGERPAAAGRAAVRLSRPQRRLQPRGAATCRSATSTPARSRPDSSCRRA